MVDDNVVVVAVVVAALVATVSLAGLFLYFADRSPVPASGPARVLYQARQWADGRYLGPRSFEFAYN